MPNASNPSIFIYDEQSGDLAGIRAVDLEQVAALNWSSAYGNYYLICGGVSYRVSKTYGDALLAAWIAYRGKFKPEEQR